MTGHTLTDRQQERIEPHCPRSISRRGRPGGDARTFVKRVLWIARTGLPRHDLPAEFGKWNAACKRFHERTGRGTFVSALKALSGEPDTECAMVDAAIVKVHRQGPSAGGLRSPTRPWQRHRRC